MIIQGCAQYDFPHDDIWCSDCSNNAQQSRQSNALEAHTIELKRGNDLREEELMLKTGRPPSGSRVKVTAPTYKTVPPQQQKETTVKGGMDVQPRKPLDK